jgi:hypothetical protein
MSFPTHPTNLRHPRSGRATILVLVLAIVLAALALPAAGQAATPAPTLATSGVSNVGYSSATLYGYVNAQGQATNYYFEYGTTTAYGTQSPLSPAGSSTSTVKINQAIKGLQAATKYHYRLVAVGPGGTVAGGDRTFTTAKIRSRSRSSAPRTRWCSAVPSTSRARSREPAARTTRSCCRPTPSPM